MREPTARTTVYLHGHPYTLRLSVIDATGRFFALLLSGRSDELTAVYGGPFVAYDGDGQVVERRPLYPMMKTD